MIIPVFAHDTSKFLSNAGVPSWRRHVVSTANWQAQGRGSEGVGSESPPRLAVNEHPAGWLFNRENLALRENNSPSSCISLRGSPWPIALYDSFAQNKGVVTKWIYRKQKAVIKWIQLYPTYNHCYGLMISSLLSSEGQTPRRCAAMATAFLTSSSLSESSPPLSRLL